MLIFVSCQTLTNSIGRTREIMVVSGSEEVFDSLSQAIQMTYYTPRREDKYQFIRVDAEKLPKILKFHMIILADPLPGTEVGEVISNLLSPKAESIVRHDRFGVFQTRNQWATHQKIMIVTAWDDSMLLKGIAMNKRRIRKLVNNHFYERIAAETFAVGEDKNKEEYLLKRYNYRIRIPTGYLLEEKFSDKGFIYLHRHNPDRSIFISKVQKPESLTIDWLLDQRDLLTLLYYEGDFAYRDLCFGGWTEINGKDVFKIYGVWQNDSIGAGGPFVTICYPEADYCYLVDGIVFAPGKKKITYLTSVEAIVSSFIHLDTYDQSAIIPFIGGVSWVTQN